MGSEIGRGSFANVYKGHYVPTRSTIAIKAVQRAKLNKKLLTNLESEIIILKTMTHPHIVRLLDYQKTSAYFFLIMEYCSLGDLSFFFRKRHEISNSLPLIASMFKRYPSTSEHGLHEDLARHFLKQLASALEFLRERQLVHRDIKPQNLLLCPPKKTEREARDAGYKGIWELPVLKLADFGFARILPNTSLAETLCGSPLYMAPEILRYEKYNAKADLWSVGAVLYEMITGRPPFRANNHVDLLSNIEKGNDAIKFPAASEASPEIRRLIRALLKKNPTERMGFVEFFNDPVIVGDIRAENKPLDQSQLNENMYISEYIQLGGPGARFPGKHTSELPSPILEREPSLSRANSSDLDKPASPVSNSSFKGIKVPPGETSPSPGASWLLQTGKQPEKAKSGGQRQELRPMDSDYVVVEKRAVEINTLADDFAQSPKEAHSHERRPSSTTRRPSSISDRRNSISYGSSPSNALTRALNMASARLFGTKVDEYGETTSTTPPQFSQWSTSPLVDPDEKDLIRKLEELATKAKVISIFAEVKFSQVMPITDTEELAPEFLVVVAQEAVVLYVKTLSLLSKAMNIASIWWKSNDSELASAKLVDTVQWVREKFNESLEKAEHAQTRISNNQEIAEKLRVKAITSEKLIFDRAMEMSRDATKNEAARQNLDGCQLSYGTAIWMLDALLEKPDSEADGLCEEDSQIVIQLRESLNHRLAVVGKKIEVELGQAVHSP